MIGIISAPLSKDDMVHSYINHTYINWVEFSGEMALIIPYDISNYELNNILQRINGIIWVGGNIENKKQHSTKQRNIYINTLRYIYQYAMNHYLPIWGTCLGMQILLMFAKNEKKISDQSFKDIGQRTMTFTGRSRMKQQFSNELIQLMEKYPSVEHHHIHGYEPVPIEGVRIVSVKNGYINAIEFIDYPFYGVQFHPERPFSKLSFNVSKEFSLFFKKECSKNKNTWEWKLSDLKKKPVVIY